jgi:hypothetical protein
MSLSEKFITAIRAQPKSANTAISKDVGIYAHTLHPLQSVDSSYKKSSALPNCLAVSSSHIFAAQAEKAIVHVYSRDRGNQEALVSFPERIHSVTLINDGLLALGTAEGRIILWEVCTVYPELVSAVLTISRFVLEDKYRPLLRISKRFLALLAHSTISSLAPKTQISMFGLYLAYCR